MNGEWSGYFYLRAFSLETDSLEHQRLCDQRAGDRDRGHGRLTRQFRSVRGRRARQRGSILIFPGTGLLKGENRLPAICNISRQRAPRSAKLRPAILLRPGVFPRRLSSSPITNGTTMSFNRDHLTHAPSKTRLDLGGKGDPNAGDYAIAAAASGWIMAIVDTNTVTCTSNNSCSDFNNYVWIAHPGGGMDQIHSFPHRLSPGKRRPGARAVRYRGHLSRE